jgi:tetratricopeptide (TPR) repeat protein
MLVIRVVCCLLLCCSLSLNASAQPSQSLLIDIRAQDVFLDPKKSLQWLADLAPEISKRGDDRVWFQLRRAQAQEQLLLLDDMIETLSYFDNRSPESGPAAALYHFLLGMHAQKSDALIEAKNQFQIAAALAETHVQTRVHIHASAELANTHSMLNENALALSINNAAYQAALASDSAFGRAETNLVFGNIYHEIALYEDSIAYYMRGLEEFESLGYRMFYVTAMFDLATTYRYEKKYEEAIFYFLKYKDSVESVAVDKSFYYSYYGLGLTLAEKGDCKKAIEQIDQGLSIQGPKGWDAELYKRKSSCHSKLGQLPEAERALLNAKSLFEELPDLKESKWEIELAKVESDLAYAKGDYKQAMDLRLAYDQKKSVLDSRAYSKRFLDVRTSMEGQKKDFEIQLLREQNEVQRLRAMERDHKGRDQIILMIGFLFLVFILAVSIRMVRKNKLP